MRALLTFLCCALCCVNILANDIITLKNGQVIEGKIYHTFDNGNLSVKKLDGNLMLVEKNDILSITQNDKNNFKESTPTDDYSHVSIGYNATFFSSSGFRSYTQNGFSAQYDYGIGLGHSIYLELGLALSYGTNTLNYLNDEWDFDIERELLQISVPVSLGYKFRFNDSFALMPYTGISLKVNAYGHVATVHNDSTNPAWFEINRFQMGWHVGARASYQNWTLGVRYNLDFLKLNKHIDTSGLTVAAGFNF